VKVVILCGGKGTRLREETEYRPKPLVAIGNMPILWHIMKIYSHYGHRDFILCLGYKGDLIKDYFLKFEELSNDFTLNLRSKNERIIHHSKANLEDWNITFVNTGQESQTGSRLARIKEFIGQDEDFLMTYGDGVAKTDLKSLLDFHKRHGKIATLTGIKPPSRFGEITADGHRVVSFSEKSSVSSGYVSGGFFILKREVFNYLSVDDDCVFEGAPLETLAKEGELMMYPHNDFWHCMDTYRDFLLLNDMWKTEGAPWKVW